MVYQTENIQRSRLFTESLWHAHASPCQSDPAWLGMMEDNPTILTIEGYKNTLG